MLVHEMRDVVPHSVKIDFLNSAIVEKSMNQKIHLDFEDGEFKYFLKEVLIKDGKVFKQFLKKGSKFQN